MDWRERIVTNPDILVGKPSVKGTRLSVELILGWLAQGWTIEVLLENYPSLTREDVLAADGRAFIVFDPFLAGPNAEEARRKAGLLNETASGPFAALAGLKAKMD